MYFIVLRLQFKKFLRITVMTRLISLFDVHPLLEALSSGQLILTPNQRLASRIRSAYAIHCEQHGGAKVVLSPRLYSLSSWVDQCWQQLLISADPAALAVKPLTASQELALWEQVVVTSDLGAALLRPTTTATQIAAAYRTLVDWRLSLDDKTQASDKLRAQFGDSSGVTGLR